MLTSELKDCINVLHRSAAGLDAAALGDRELLERFFGRREEWAFAALLGRHGPMVLAVCRRALRDSHAAEDAFQATFLVLVRKGRSLSQPEKLGAWLYGVAFHTARKAQTMLARDLEHRRPIDDIEYKQPLGSADCDELEWLDVELANLPAKYRDPVVLCYLQGQSKRQAASTLGWPEGTVSVRLDRARKMLRDRLSRRGVAWSVAGLALIGAAGSVRAAVAATLIDKTLAVVSTSMAASFGANSLPASISILCQGVLRTMWITKLKSIAAGAALVCAAGVFTAVFAHTAYANRPALEAQASVTRVQPPGDSTPILEQSFEWEFPTFVRSDKVEKKPQGPTIQGTMKSSDATKKTVTVVVPKLENGQKSSEEKTLELAADVRIHLYDILNKKDQPPEGKLTDLSPGTRLNLQLDADGKKVVLIGAQGPGMQGGVKAVDASNSTITLTTKTKDGGADEATYKLMKDAKIFLDNPLANKGDKQQEGSFKDLTENSHVHVQLTVDRKSILGVHVLGKSVHGTLKAHDSGNMTITISVKEDGQLVDKTYTLSKDARILDLNEGAGVNLRFSTTDKEKVVIAQGRKQN